jgi:hypothetical protein
MRIYIIAKDGVTLSRGAPAAMTEGEIAVASKEELHAAPLSGSGFWHCGTLYPVSKSAERSVTARR